MRSIRLSSIRAFIESAVVPRPVPAMMPATAAPTSGAWSCTQLWWMWAPVPPFWITMPRAAKPVTSHHATSQLGAEISTAAGSAPGTIFTRSSFWPAWVRRTVFVNTAGARVLAERRTKPGTGDSIGMENSALSASRIASPGSSEGPRAWPVRIDQSVSGAASMARMGVVQRLLHIRDDHTRFGESL